MDRNPGLLLLQVHCDKVEVNWSTPLQDKQ